MVGVLAVGSDYGWDTLKTLLIQRPGRMRVFGAKVAAVAVTLVPLFGSRASSRVPWPATSSREPRTRPSTGRPCWNSSVGSRRLVHPRDVGGVRRPARGRLPRNRARHRAWDPVRARHRGPAQRARRARSPGSDALVEYFLRANAYSLVSAIGVPTAPSETTVLVPSSVRSSGRARRSWSCPRTGWASWRCPPCCSAVGTSHERRA